MVFPKIFEMSFNDITKYGKNVLKPCKGIS